MAENLNPCAEGNDGAQQQYDQQTSWVVGVDGGASKTHAVLLAANGQIVAEAETGPGNIHAVGAQQAQTHLEGAIMGVLQQAGEKFCPPVPRVCIGLAGVDDPKDQTHIRQLLSALPVQRLDLINDACVALAAGAGAQPGVVVIAGTGSQVFGRDATGTTTRVGGWGWYASDEGSATWLARQAIKAAVWSHDGRLPKSSLEQRLLERSGYASLRDLLRAIHFGTMERPAIAKLFLVVQHCADNGDEVATTIVQRGINHLAEMVQVVVGRLNFESAKFPVVMTGGVFAASSITTQQFSQIVQSTMSMAQVIPTKISNAAGAAVLALANEGITLSLEEVLP